MNLNLIEDAWIPARTKEHKVRLIAPWEITSPEIEALSAPRADFQSNLLVFLIGLCQTLLTPEDDEEWLNRLDEPPVPERLRELLLPGSRYFALDHSGDRFMQDAATREREDNAPMLELLLETPTGQTLKHNKDLFTKRKDQGALCLPCAAAALYTLQANAPEGGRGQNVSLRGGGPLTTLIEGETLWETIWSNVLTKDDLARLPGTGAPTAEKVYPWMATLVQGGKGGRPTIPNDGHPFMMYWGTPRRIHLDDPVPSGTCSVCGATEQPVVETYRTAPNGFQYQAWTHPLSPVREDAAGKRSLRTSGRGMTYRDWLGMVLVDQGRNVQPAEIVQTFRRERLPNLEGRSFSVLAFGYQTRQNTVLSWQESRMPLRRLAQADLPEFDESTGILVQGAQAMADTLERSVRQALFRRPGDAKGDLSYITLSYWSRTHPAFYAHQDRLVPSAPADVLETMDSWHSALCVAGERVFREYVLSVPFGQVDPQRIATAWTWLRRNFRSGKMRETFHLPKSTKKDARPMIVGATQS